MVSRTYYIEDNELNLNCRYKNTKEIKTADIKKFISETNFQFKLKIKKQEF